MIKTILFILILLGSIATGNELPLVPSKPHQSVYNHILKNSPKLDKAYANKLAKAVYIAATKHNLNPLKVSAILRQECQYKLRCINDTTLDYGIGQINYKTIKAFNFNKERLLTDLDYSVEAAVLVLADFKRMFGHKEKDWYCRYNVGTGPRIAVEDKCTAYKILVARFM